MRIYANQQPQSNSKAGGAKSDNRGTKGGTPGRDTLTAVYPGGVGRFMHIHIYIYMYLCSYINNIYIYICTYIHIYTYEILFFPST